MKMKRSGIMKKAVLLILSIVLTFAICGATPAASKKSKALKAYGKYLEKHASVVQFGILYLDKDSVPELAVIERNSSGWKTGDLFSYKNGKVRQYNTGKYVTSMSTIFRGFYKKKGIVEITSDDAGSQETWYCRISGMYLRPVTEKWNSRGTTYCICSPFSKVTKKQFNAELKKYTGGRKLTKIKYYSNTASERKKRLK